MFVILILVENFLMQSLDQSDVKIDIFSFLESLLVLLLNLSPDFFFLLL